VIEATVFRAIGGPPPQWESLPPELLRLPEELALDALLDDPAFFAPFAPHFHPVLGRPSTPVECNMRPVPGVKVVRALERAGFTVVRISGSHHVMHQADGRAVVADSMGSRSFSGICFLESSGSGGFTASAIPLR
jgi:predicted RNA binding protein YcfA (HicA-like mRNA interferase family)